jgi:signal transduction histidine kinase
MDDENKIITILKETALEAELGNLEKKTFLTAMNHKMRVPMNSIMGMLRLLQDTELSENQEGYVSAAFDAAKYLLSLLEEFTIFSK